MLHRPKAVLFDHDGVLVASESLHIAAWDKVLAELGLEPDHAFLKASVGTTAPQTIARLLDLYRPGWTETDYDPHALAARKNVFYNQLATTSLEPYDGVREGLKWLKDQDVRVAVVSNAKKLELESALAKLGLLPFLDVTISRDEARVPKPDPTGYLMAAAHLGIEPALCMAVEDSPPGIEAALIANIPAAAILTNFSREAMAQPVPGRPDLKPTWIVNSIVEFFEKLAAL